MRLPADSAHDLSSFVHFLYNSSTEAGWIVTSNDANGLHNNIFSYRHASADKAPSRNQKMDTECKWFYTPSACEDCWYSGKTVTVDIIYKKAPITKTTSSDDDGTDWVVTSTNALGSWSTHSTVTQTLTLPSGFTRQQVGSTFSVPTQDGYVVALDDIKFVSVA
jgi:hypothetical protein